MNFSLLNIKEDYIAISNILCFENVMFIKYIEMYTRYG